MNEIIEAEFKEVMPERLTVIAAEIQLLSQTVFNGIIEIGRRFAEAKRICPRGQWGSWVTDVTGYKQSMAENYIKVFNEYGGGQINIGGDFSNSQSFANLGITKLLELTTIPAEEREAFVKEHDVENITVRQLQEELRLEKKKNDNAAVQLRKYADAAERSQDNISKLRTEAEMYQEQINRLEGEIKQIEERTKRDAEREFQSDMERFRAESEAAAKEEMQAELDKLKKAAKDKQKRIKDLEEQKQRLAAKLESEKKRADNATKETYREVSIKNELREKLEASDERNKELAAEIEKLKRSALTSGASEDLVRISVKFQTVQNEVQELMELIESVDGAEKYHNAVVATIRDLLE
ncbi:MAG: DUF3102 domain-containing protein, partial [bacterium]|nr:DUF3102 domain-containing protein [bacterium]